MPKTAATFSPYQRKMIFFACILIVMGLAAIDFINPSLPYIMKSLQVSQAQTKGLMIVYLMTIGIAQLFYGSFSDNYGRRIAILTAFVIVIIGFIVSALSQTIAMLYIGRSLTALGIAGCHVISRAIIADVCSTDLEFKKAFAYWGMSSQLSPALAPILGGVIQQYFNWHWSFAFLACFNLLVFFIFYFLMPESHQAPVEKSSLTQQIGIYGKLFILRHFMNYSFLSALIFVFTMGFYTLTPFIFHTLGFTPIENGLFYGIYALGLVSGAWSLSGFPKTWPMEKIFFCSIIVLPIMFGIAIMLFSLAGQNIALIAGFTLILAFMVGITAPLALALCLQGFSQDKGAASAVQSFIKFFIAGAAMLVFNFVVLHHFIQLAIIFLVMALVILCLYLLERSYERHRP